MKIGKYVNRVLRRTGFEIRRVSASRSASETWIRTATSEMPVPYIERPEYGPSNIETKLENVEKGLPFELPDVLNLNRAVMKLVCDERRIVELGAGTGFFAYEVAASTDRIVVASEYDRRTYEWAVAHRSRPNITYINGPVPPEKGPFDLVVAIEVIEHIWDFPKFIRTCAELAPRALFTTPNRAGMPKRYRYGPPGYFKHVREWTGGEFYWILRCFYDQVSLYAMTSQTEPLFVSVSVEDLRSPLIADCQRPRG